MSVNNHTISEWDLKTRNEIIDWLEDHAGQEFRDIDGIARRLVGFMKGNPREVILEIRQYGLGVIADYDLTRQLATSGIRWIARESNYGGYLRNLSQICLLEGHEESKPTVLYKSTCKLCHSPCRKTAYMTLCSNHRCKSRRTYLKALNRSHPLIKASYERDDDGFLLCPECSNRALLCSVEDPAFVYCMDKKHGWSPDITSGDKMVGLGNGFGRSAYFKWVTIGSVGGWHPEYVKIKRRAVGPTMTSTIDDNGETTYEVSLPF